MTEKVKYKPIGGIVEAELFAVGSLSSEAEVVAGAGVKVPLIDDGSSYEESFSADEKPVSVQCTLTLCSEPSLASEWFNEDFLQRAASDGLAAIVTLASGQVLRLGYSQRFGFERALRLKSLDYSSGHKPTSAPSVKLVLSSHNVTSALK